MVSKEDLGLAQENDRLRRENRFLKEERGTLITAKMFFASQKPIGVCAFIPGRRLHSNLPRAHHTDRGSQSGSHDYQETLRQLGVTTSMSGKGNC